MLQKTFCYSVKADYLILSSHGEYATVPSECDMLTCVFTKEHICEFDTVLSPTEKVFWCPYALF